MKRYVPALLVTAIFAFLLLSCNVIWTSPGFYKLSKYEHLEEPIMDMQAYEDIIETHKRPYVYSVKGQDTEEAFIIGVDHTKNIDDPQLDTIKAIFSKLQPDVVLIEGRLGFLFTWLQDPVKKYGESGFTYSLAKRHKAEVYTWEPTREDEINMLIHNYSPAQMAMFYSFRPYFSNMRFGKPENPEKKLQQYLDSRTDYKHIKGVYKSWEELDSAWTHDFPGIEWRTYSDAYGWPEGYLADLANTTNLARDEHMVRVILENIRNGKTVLITMGASHAPRIEKTLKAALK